MEHEGDADTNYNKCDRNNPQSKGTRRLRNQRTSRDHPNYSIVKIGQNTEKSPGDFRNLSLFKTPVKDHQLTLLRKILKGVK